MGDDRQKIGVIAPSRNNMLVKMSCNSSTSHLTLVHADIEAMVAGAALQRRHCLLGQQSDFGNLRRRGLVIGVDVTIRANQ